MKRKKDAAAVEKEEDADSDAKGVESKETSTAKTKEAAAATQAGDNIWPCCYKEGKRNAFYKS